MCFSNIYIWKISSEPPWIDGYWDTTPLCQPSNIPQEQAWWLTPKWKIQSYWKLFRRHMSLLVLSLEEMKIIYSNKPSLLWKVQGNVNPGCMPPKLLEDIWRRETKVVWGWYKKWNCWVEQQKGYHVCYETRHLLLLPFFFIVERAIKKLRCRNPWVDNEMDLMLASSIEWKDFK
jgi:hypothetical protein